MFFEINEFCVQYIYIFFLRDPAFFLPEKQAMLISEIILENILTFEQS